MQVSRRDVPDLLRGVGGLLFAAGAAILLIRKSSHHQWGQFALLLVAMVPAVVLYALALSAAEAPGSESRRLSRPLLLVASILLWPVALAELLRWAGANTNNVLYGAAVFAVTALLAGYAARRAQVPYAALLAGLASLVAWLLLWEKILGRPSANTYRWLLIAAGALLLIVAASLGRGSAIGAGEVATAGGLAAVAAGVLGVVVGALVGAIGAIGRTIEAGHTTAAGPRVSSHLPPHLEHASSVHPQLPAGPPHLSLTPPLSPSGTIPSLIHTSGLQHLGWDLYLLIVSLGLVWLGARARVRGLGYVGGAGLLAFVLSAGLQVTRFESGHAGTHSIVGWPLVLLILGIVGLIAPALYRRREL